MLPFKASAHHQRRAEGSACSTLPAAGLAAGLRAGDVHAGLPPPLTVLSRGSSFENDNFR